MKKEGTDMIKGCQKKAVLVRCPKSRIFEEAYLIMRESEEPVDDTDIVSEADRILSECTVKGQKRHRTVHWSDFLFFAAGVVVAGLAFGLLLLFMIIINI